MIKLIEAWFAEHDDDGEFIVGVRGWPYSVVGPLANAGRVVFTTKPRVIAPAMYENKATQAADACGLIGRGGLPRRADLEWLSRTIGSGEVFFLGDMDPSDLMVFAWLRASLGAVRVTFAGINDALLAAAGLPLAMLATPQPSTMPTTTAASPRPAIPPTTPPTLPLAPSEQESLTLLEKVLPDLGELLGPGCVRLLEQGRKIELEALRVRKTGDVAIARAVGS